MYRPVAAAAASVATSSYHCISGAASMEQMEQLLLTLAGMPRATCT